MDFTVGEKQSNHLQRPLKALLQPKPPLPSIHVLIIFLAEFRQNQAKYTPKRFTLFPPRTHNSGQNLGLSVKYTLTFGQEE